MAEKGGTKILAIITVCIMLISIGLSGCIWKEEGNEDNYDYSVVYTPENHTTDYYLILPFLVHKKNHSKPNQELISELNKELDERDKFEIESTPYGVGINFSHKSYLNFIVGGKPTTEMVNYEIGVYNISHPLEKGYYWVFSSINGTLDYSYQIMYDEWEIDTYILKADLKTGWQLKEGIINVK